MGAEPLRSDGIRPQGSSEGELLLKDAISLRAAQHTNPHMDIQQKLSILMGDSRQLWVTTGKYQTTDETRRR